MILTGCAIQAGDVLYRRFARAQLKRQLGKLTPLIAVCLSVSLLTSQMAVGQTTTQAKPKRKSYQTMFTLASGIAVQSKNICKTDACAKAADELIIVVNDGQEKHRKGLLVDETRKQFHADFNASLLKLRTALVDSLPAAEKKPVAETNPFLKVYLAKPAAHR